MKPPDLMDQLANADLSAKNAPPPSMRTEYSSSKPTHTKSVKYRGNDRRVGERPDFKGVSDTGNGYELNFNEAALSELAKVILRDTLEIPYVFDPRVQGRVTLSTGGPVSKEELLSILETVVAMNRGSLITDGKLYRIIPDTGGRQSAGVSIDYVTEQKKVGPGYGVSIIPLKFISTETMMRMLGSFVGRANVLKASVNNNLLIVRGSSKERQSLLEIAIMFDVDWMKGQSAGIYTLKNASPAEVIPELRQVFQTDGQGKGLLRFQPINRLNAVLVLTQKSELLDRVDQWVARLDRDGTEGDNYFVYRVENAKAKELADILNATFGGGGGIVRGAEVNEVTPSQPAAQVSSFDISGQSDVPGGGANQDNAPQEQQPQQTVSSSKGKSLASAGSGEVRIIADEINNKLIIKASGRIYRKILSVLRRLDKPPLQVLVNATLAEVTLNDNLQYGVQFFLQKNKGKDGLLGFSNNSLIELAPSVPGLNFIIGSTTSPRVVIDAIAAETAVRVISSPSIVVLNHQAATLQVGDEVPIATRQVNSVTDAQAPVVNEIQFRDTGVILKVTPHINSNGLVTMEVQQEISAVTSSTAVGDSGTLTPTISQRRISSTIAVQSGQMVVLAGLISEQTDREKSRVPIIRKIPYLGDIIGNTDIAKTRTELIVFLQPRVIRKPRDASRVAEEIRARMQSLAPRPAAWDEEEAEQMNKFTKSSMK